MARKNLKVHKRAQSIQRPVQLCADRWMDNGICRYRTGQSAL